ncbi:MAG: hypothetical protein K6T83_05125 [Alicyclobacillus sp.]|nr:hypothetical protein [Alicyclobacillus sp.]
MAESDNKNKSEGDLPWPELPTAFQHRLAMKWVTLESLRILSERCKTRGMTALILLITAHGPIQGSLSDFAPSYEDAIKDQNVSEIDVASATVHLRTDLWKTYEARDAAVAPVDSAAIIHVANAVLRIGGRRLQIPHLALFADDVLGFTLLSHGVL